MRSLTDHVLRLSRSFAVGALLLVLASPSWAGGAPEKTPAEPVTPAASVPATPPPAASPALHAGPFAALGTIDLDTFIAGMEADRLLLAEVRKDLPDKRSDADLYLKRLKELAGTSDPARLVPRVNRLLEQESVYYDWMEKNAGNQNQGQAADNEYVVGGARGFVVAFQEFQNALFLTVINRLDIAERALQEAAAPSPAQK